MTGVTTAPAEEPKVTGTAVVKAAVCGRLSVTCVGESTEVMTAPAATLPPLTGWPTARPAVPERFVMVFCPFEVGPVPFSVLAETAPSFNVPFATTVEPVALLP